ncbi:MAG TPA: hypothetical protein VIK86_06125 [Candidatus Paceibacterota bacterium]
MINIKNFSTGMENDSKYKRIIILGGSGSGKSTLANRMGLYTGYPIYHMDKMLHNPDWSRKDKNEWGNICNEFLSKDIGIVDGNYTSIMPNRLNWADLIIFIDTPTRVKIYRFIRRNIRGSLGLDEHYGIPEGAKERFSVSFILWLYRWDKNFKTKIFSMLESVKDKKVLIIKEPRELDIVKLLK